MEAEICRVSFAQMDCFVRAVLRGIGVPPDDAALCAEVLITADKRGIDSHGVARLKTIYYDRIVKDRIQQPVTHFDVVRDVKATAVVDGHDGMGMVIAHRAMGTARYSMRMGTRLPDCSERGSEWPLRISTSRG